MTSSRREVGGVTGLHSQVPCGHGNRSERSAGWQLAAFSLSCRVVGLRDLEFLWGRSLSKFGLSAVLTAREEALELVPAPSLCPHPWAEGGRRGAACPPPRLPQGEHAGTLYPQALFKHFL